MGTNPFMLCGTATPVQCTPNYALIALVGGIGLLGVGLVTDNNLFVVIGGLAGAGVFLASKIAL